MAAGGRARYLSRYKGFTLIEILVVVLIIGIMIGVALIVPNVGGALQKVKDEAFRFQVLVEQARERALIEDREIGLSLTRKGYRWWQWSQDDEKWKLLDEASFREYKLTEDVVLNDNSKNSRNRSLVQDEQSDSPTLIFYTDTQMTPFFLEFSLKGDNQRAVQLESDGIGPVLSL
ncbi:type II secretion system minor pseudopilin GspH [Sansalvadorimonas sp. 2012CJ34-2]|uniref:Type II secretion system protein H n=1 Tax=Parendozoicomonas callyspongiae TaxID=2942213 RepID=A0ABT0PIB7_9GAMM|nr:type II secretion system minor pseudopilin GspH [Sansalvadorimonas sp. 2012CJ34-2]MCL6271144.1 type II secretion system minor pseudopilin GspH [Sansalvadorimonas sp. 2012CJ34-2]